ncbi:unnamed protein product [Adineta steineri]|uniref:Helicase ATP-binding domain-containing protein n=1 Tax=Adineta steineri TaxID=433720 RepID=A0A814MNY1_9BILA|nr:unnamed protein product [Adineta steineri]CAF1441939.1 unnamed protein product [Adineta steineri]
MTNSTEHIKETFTPTSDQNKSILARNYQTELMEQAKGENLIICLPTGSGKTYIAVMLIKEMASSIRESLKKGGKRTIFLVQTVQLAQQQTDYIRKHTGLLVESYYGEKGVDLWHKERWDIEFEDHQVLVFTAQVFRNLVGHDYFSLKSVNLIIFDECHHASGDNHYAALMNKHYDDCPDPPRVLGLTASITNKKIKRKDLMKHAQNLKETYRAEIVTRDESIQHGTSVNVETIPCPSYKDEILKKNESLIIPFDVR